MQRGEIYFLDFDPVAGREQGGYRPALVVSADVINRSPLVVTVVPGTDAANLRKLYRSHVLVPAVESGLALDTVFLCFQARAVDPSRFLSPPVGRLSPRRMADVARALAYVFDIPTGSPPAATPRSP